MVVVGADSDGAWHQQRAASARQKAANLSRILGVADLRLVFAVAEPSVEAWLMADPEAFREGLKEALGIAFRPPAHWPVPQREREAKEALTRLVHDALGDHLSRDGFEFADSIVPGMSLDRPQALAQFVRDLSRAIERAAHAP